MGAPAPDMRPALPCGVERVDVVIDVHLVGVLAPQLTPEEDDLFVLLQSSGAQHMRDDSLRGMCCRFSRVLPASIYTECMTDLADRPRDQCLHTQGGGQSRTWSPFDSQIQHIRGPGGGDSAVTVACLPFFAFSSSASMASMSSSP